MGAALLLSGCALVETVDRNGATRRSFIFASPVNIATVGGDAARVTRMTGLGAGVGAGTYGLGFYKMTVIQMDSRCNVVLVGNTAEELKSFVKLSGKPDSICNDNISKGPDHDRH